MKRRKRGDHGQDQRIKAQPRYPQMQPQLHHAWHLSLLLAAITTAAGHILPPPPEGRARSEPVCASAAAAGSGSSCLSAAADGSLARRASSPTSFVGTSALPAPSTMVSSAASSPSASSAVACNNSPLLCGRTYNSVTHLYVLCPSSSLTSPTDHPGAPMTAPLSATPTTSTPLPATSSSTRH